MDYSQSKSFGTSIYPVHAEQTSGLLRRAEPFLTPEQLISRFLKGIPLTFRNGDTFSNDDLKDKINLAINEAELLLGRNINKEAFKEKAAFDRNLYKAFIHIKTEHGPIASIEHLAIVSSDGNNIYEIPPAWIEAANFSKNLINVIPLLTAFVSNSFQQPNNNSGIGFLSLMSGLGFIPAYWQVRYSAGLSNKEGQVPIPVNELIGTIAAIAILSQVAASNIYTSQSLSQDGISQSSSGPGPRLYELRVSELTDQRDLLIKKLKGLFSSKYFISNI